MPRVFFRVPPYPPVSSNLLCVVHNSRGAGETRGLHSTQVDPFWSGGRFLCVVCSKKKLTWICNEKNNYLNGIDDFFSEYEEMCL